MSKGISLDMQSLFETDALKIVVHYINKNTKSLKLFDTYEDMRQELLMQVWKMLPKYDASRGAFTTFVWMICKTEVKKKNRYIKTQKRNVNIISIEDKICDGINIYDLINGGVNAEDLQSESDFISDVKSMLNTETYEYYINGKTQKDIATELQLSQASISRRIKRNIKYIRNELRGREL